MWKIDAFCHILPPKYLEAMNKKSKGPKEVYHLGRYGLDPQPGMTDIDERLRAMDKHEGYVQILNISLPPPEDITSGQDTIDLARLANDCLAELVYKYPDRFVAATACLPLNDIDAAIDELDRCIKQLKFCGIQITSTIQDKPLDSPEFEPLWERMSYYNLPIQIHPRTIHKGKRAFAESHQSGDPVGFWAQTAYNWPYETTIAMGRLVFSGVLERYPNLKFLTHHMGGVTPYHIKRITFFTQTATMRLGGNAAPDMNLTKPYEDYYKMFYADTAVYGYVPTLMEGHAFFGAEHILFGTDLPYDSMGGSRLIPETIRSVQEMPIPDAEKKMIFEDNARRLFRLPI